MGLGRPLGVVALGAASGLVAAAAVTAAGYAPAELDLRLGQAWLASSAVGQISLVDGSTGDVAARLAVAAGELAVAQADGGALVADRSTGAVVAVDGATQSAGPPRQPLPGAAAGITVFTRDGAAAAYAVDAERGTAIALDPATAAPRGQQLSLGAKLDRAATAVDAAGRLWAVDVATGDVVWLDRDGKHQVRGVATAGLNPLVLAGSRPVVIDPRQRLALRLDPGTGRPVSRGCLDLLPEEEFAAGGASSSDLVLVTVSARNALLIADPDRNDCSRVVTLAQGELGAPVETGGRVFVPNFTTGQVHVVTLDGDRVVASPRVLPGRLDSFELIPRDGAVFYNDPASERAGVIRLDGGHTPVQKYDPNGLAPGDDPGPGSGSGSDRGAEDQPTPDKPAARRTPPAVERPDGDSGRSALRVQVSQLPAVAGRPVGLAVSSRERLRSAEWEFGDGSAPARGLRVAHTWRDPGQYRVTVRAATAAGGTLFGSLTMTVVPAQTRPTTSPSTSSPSATSSSTATPTVTPTETPTTSTSTTTSTTAEDRPPVAALGMSATQVRVGEELHVLADDSFDDDAVTRLDLDWGDGASDTADRPRDASWRHAYSAAGSYRVTLTVTDTAGQEDTASVTVRVTQPAPVVIAQGTISLGDLWDFDLDTGRSGAGDVFPTAISAMNSEGEVARSDFYNAESGVTVSPASGASACPTAEPTGSSAEVHAGGTVCVATDRGNRTALVATRTDTTYQIRYITWRIG